MDFSLQFVKAGHRWTMLVAPHGYGLSADWLQETWAWGHEDHPGLTAMPQACRSDAPKVHANDPGLKSEPAPANLIKMRAPIEVQSMDGSGTKTHGPIAQSELDKITRGSMVQVYDPETDVWYWVIERRLKDPHWLQGRIDAHCVVLGPTLRHGGRVFFHEDNVLYIFSAKVHPMFDATWFRVLSHFLSMGKGIKALKPPQTP